MTPVQTITSDLLPVVTVIVGICVPVVTLKATQWLGVSIDAAHRSALDAAIETAIGKIIAIGTGGLASAVRTISGAPSDIEAAVASVKRDAPKAVSHLGLSDADLADKINTRLTLARGPKGLTA